MKQILFLGAMILWGATQSALSAPPDEVMGTYTGVMSDTVLDHQTGKATPANKKQSIELKTEPDATVVFTVGENVYVMPDAIIGKTSFTCRVVQSSAILLIKGKFVGKGRKIKATTTFSHAGTWSEGKISAQKIE